jgi:hypothetical protein
MTHLTNLIHSLDPKVSSIGLKSRRELYDKLPAPISLSLSKYELVVVKRCLQATVYTVATSTCTCTSSYFSADAREKVENEGSHW